MLIICKNCGYFIAPLASSSHYMNIDIEDYRFGNHFLAMKRYVFPSMKIEHDNSIFSTSAPFLYIFLRPIHCDYCYENIGLFLPTANVHGTEWLLNRCILNMEKLELDVKRSMLMESTISLLHG